MLSGVEIVGIVLGALPLVIEAFEQGRTIWKANKNFASRRRPVERLLRGLRFQSTLLESRLKTVLIAIDDDVSEDVEVLTARLQDKENLKLIEKHLGKQAFDAFCTEVEICGELVERIAGKIEGLVPKGTNIQNLREVLEKDKGKEWTFEIKKSFSLSLKKAEIEELIEELKESSQNIKELFDLPTRQVPGPTALVSKKLNKLATSLNRARESANRLCLALHQCCRKCTHSTHIVGLFLEDRFEAYDGPKSSNSRLGSTNEVFFRFVVWCGSTPASAIDTPWYETAAEVPVLDDSLPFSGSIGTGSSMGAFQSGPQVTVTSQPGGGAVQPSFVPVQNICSSVRQAKTEKKVWKLRLEGEEEFSGLKIDPPSPTHMHMINCTTSLDEILTNSYQSKDVVKKLDARYRTLLALRLASSVLQLLATPWLATLWSSKTICFFSRPGAQAPVSPAGQHSTPATAINLENPSLRHYVDARLTTSTQPTEPELIRHLFLELGIMLLELYYEKPMAAQYDPKIYGTADSYYERQSLAKRWIDDSRYHIFEDYMTPVKQCVDCAFEPRSHFPDWNNEIFRMSVCQTVIEPLISFCGGWRFS